MHFMVLCMWTASTFNTNYVIAFSSNMKEQPYSVLWLSTWSLLELPFPMTYLAGLSSPICACNDSVMMTLCMWTASHTHALFDFSVILRCRFITYCLWHLCQHWPIFLQPSGQIRHTVLKWQIERKVHSWNIFVGACRNLPWETALPCRMMVACSKKHIVLSNIAWCKITYFLIMPFCLRAFTKTFHTSLLRSFLDK